MAAHSVAPALLSKVHRRSAGDFQAPCRSTVRLAHRAEAAAFELQPSTHSRRVCVCALRLVHPFWGAWAVSGQAHPLGAPGVNRVAAPPLGGPGLGLAGRGKWGCLRSHGASAPGRPHLAAPPRQGVSRPGTASLGRPDWRHSTWSRTGSLLRPPGRTQLRTASAGKRLRESGASQRGAFATHSSSHQSGLQCMHAACRMPPRAACCVNAPWTVLLHGFSFPRGVVACSFRMWHFVLHAAWVLLSHDAACIIASCSGMRAVCRHGPWAMGHVHVDCCFRNCFSAPTRPRPGPCRTALHCLGMSLMFSHHDLAVGPI